MPTSTTRMPVRGWFGISSSSPTNERHLRRHHSHELNVGVEREAGHVHDRARYVLKIDSRLDRDLTVRLRDTLVHALRHFGGGVADVNLAACDVVLAAIKRR